MIIEVVWKEKEESRKKYVVSHTSPRHIFVRRSNDSPIPQNCFAYNRNDGRSAIGLANFNIDIDETFRDCPYGEPPDISTWR